MDADSAPVTVRDFPVTESQYSEFHTMPENYENLFSSFHFPLPTTLKKKKKQTGFTCLFLLFIDPPCLSEALQWLSVWARFSYVA